MKVYLSIMGNKLKPLNLGVKVKALMLAQGYVCL